MEKSISIKSNAAEKRTRMRKDWKKRKDGLAPST